MTHPERVLDLIEAIEVSAEKFHYQFSLSQQILITKMRRKATQGLHIPDECWDNLCELFNLVEGRLNPIPKEAVAQSERAVNSMVYYCLIPAILFFIGLILIGTYLIVGTIK